MPKKTTNAEIVGQKLTKIAEDAALDLKAKAVFVIACDNDDMAFAAFFGANETDIATFAALLRKKADQLEATPPGKYQLQRGFSE
jgi:hypothetical protein